jgi:hypothetical protein
MAWLRAAASETGVSVGYAQPEFTGDPAMMVSGDDVVLFPRCTNRHWWLGVYNLRANTLALLNSANATRSAAVTKRDLARLLEGILSVFGDRPDVIQEECPQQTDAHSCGLWLIRFAANAAGVQVVLDRASALTELFPELDNRESEDEPRDDDG